jgi:Ig-like domain from next to BRCA1 gene
MTGLGWAMQKFRLVYGKTLTETAQAYGRSPSYLSRAKRGAAKPSRSLVKFYDDTFEADGLLLSLFEVVDETFDQRMRRAGGRRRKTPRAAPGDATAFVDQSVPHGLLLKPGEVFAASWRIRNAGSVTWRDRRLERQGPITGPGLITSARHTPIPDTGSGDVVEVSVVLKAPTYDATSIAYFKMVDAEGYLCFPDEHQLGLDVLVRVERNVAGAQ